MKSPAKIIQSHYGLTRPVTPEEVAAEIANLRRREAKGTLYGMDETLFHHLHLDRAPVSQEADWRAERAAAHTAACVALGMALTPEATR